MLTSETIALPGGRRQLVYRAGDGAALVWLHSLYGVEADARIIEALARHHTVLAPLAPGFADLDELDELRDIHDLALHYDDVLEALQLDHAIVAGHSFGAMIGAELAAHVPRRVARLILLSPLGLWNDRYPVADLFGVPAAEVPTLLYADLSKAPGSAAKPDVEAILSLTRGMTTVARFLWPIPDRGLSRRLRRVRAATLVVYGAEDRFVPPQYADEFVQRIPSASATILPGAGHMLTVEALDAVMESIEAFLSQSPNRVEAVV
jgi:pimeloyl-ACP methyl ester carboxylesterase